MDPRDDRRRRRRDAAVRAVLSAALVFPAAVSSAQDRADPIPPAAAAPSSGGAERESLLESVSGRVEGLPGTSPAAIENGRRAVRAMLEDVPLPVLRNIRTYGARVILYGAGQDLTSVFPDLKGGRAPDGTPWEKVAGRSRTMPDGTRVVAMSETGLLPEAAARSGDVPFRTMVHETAHLVHVALQLPSQEPLPSSDAEIRAAHDKIMALNGATGLGSYADGSYGEDFAVATSAYFGVAGVPRGAVRDPMRMILAGIFGPPRDITAK